MGVCLSLLRLMLLLLIAVIVVVGVDCVRGCLVVVAAAAADS